MTVVVHIGRRVPKSWFRRGADKIKGLLTFQENIWQMIVLSMKTAKRKANGDTRLQFKIENDEENEDLNYKIQWLKVTIQGTPEIEEEEYNDSLKMYDALSKTFKKDLPVDERLAAHFKTSKLSPLKLKEAYTAGYGAVENNNIANKLLEMGIFTHIEWIKDFEGRTEVFY